MNQKKIGDKLYVFSETPYVITEDTDADVIIIQLECLDGFAELNSDLADKMVPYNYHMFTVKPLEWSDYYNDYTITVASVTGGTLSASPLSADPGEEVTLTNTPSTGYEFVSYSVTSGGEPVTVTDNKFTMPEGNVTVSGTFDKLVFDITIDPSITNGTITTNVNEASLGDTITITATPSTGYTLDTLTVMNGDIPVTVTNNKFTMPLGDVTISGTFVQLEYNITVANPIGSGTTTTDVQTAHYGETITINATPESGYKADALYVTNGTNSIPVASNQFTMPAGDVTVKSLYNPTTTSSSDYFTIQSLEDGNKFTYGEAIWFGLNISADGGSTWDAAVTYYNTPLTMNFGDEVMIKGNNNTFNRENGGGSDEDLKFKLTKTYKAKGNIMSLLHDSSFDNATLVDTTNNNAFYKLFSYDTKLVDAGDLLLPYMTLTASCYREMFKNCTNLTTAPSLPATTLVESCYRNMFDTCTSLTTAPSLPATTLTTECYKFMFKGCTSLVTAPSLPATTLVGGCYTYMFDGCTSLSNITMLATNIGSNNTTNWVRNVASEGTFTKAAAMTSLPSGTSGIPSGWTVVDYAE